MSTNKLSVTIQSNNLFEIMNENVFYEGLNLTEFNDYDLTQLFSGTILADYHVQKKCLEIKNQVEAATLQSKEDWITADFLCLSYTFFDRLIDIHPYLLDRLIVK